MSTVLVVPASPILYLPHPLCLPKTEIIHSGGLLTPARGSLNGGKDCPPTIAFGVSPLLQKNYKWLLHQGGN